MTGNLQAWKSWSLYLIDQLQQGIIVLILNLALNLSILGWESPALHLKALLFIRYPKSTSIKFELPVRRLVEPFSSLLFIYLQVIMAFSIEATTKHYMGSSHYQI
jgi:hypothetical protein